MTSKLYLVLFALGASSSVLPSTSKRSTDISTDQLASRLGNGAFIGDACHPPGSYRLGGNNDAIPPCISEQAISLKCEQWMSMSATASQESKSAYRQCMLGTPSSLSNDVYGCLECKLRTGAMSQNDNQLWRSIYNTAFASFSSQQEVFPRDTFWNGYVKPVVEGYVCGNARGWACFRPNPSAAASSSSAWSQSVNVRDYYNAAPGSQNCGQFNYNYNNGLNGGGVGNTTYGPQPGQIQPGQIQPGQVQPGQIQPGQIQPGQVQPGQVQPGQIQPGPIQPGQVQPGPIQPGQVQTPPGFVSQVWYRFDRYARYQLVQSTTSSSSSSSISGPAVASTAPGGSVQVQVGLAPSAYYFLFTGADDFTVRAANGPVVPIQGSMVTVTSEQARQLPPSCGCGSTNMQTYSQQFSGWQRAQGVQPSSFSSSSQQDWSSAYAGQSAMVFNAALGVNASTSE